MRINYQKIYPSLPAVLMSMADSVITFAGQPVEYWSNYSKYAEANPLFGYLLGCGPSYFLLGTLLWILMIIYATLLLPKLLSLLWASSFVIGHAFGFLTWLLYKHEINFNWIYLYFPAVAAIVIWQARFYYLHSHAEV